MTQEYFFGQAKWVCREDRDVNSFSVLCGSFYASSAKKVSLNILGLGFFKCYINGVCVNPDTFLPLSSDYEPGCDPVDEIISGHRTYVPTFDITSLVKDGENTIAVHFGGGWYTWIRVYGLPKAIYRISVEDKNGVRDYVSDESCRIGRGYMEKYVFVNHEQHNYAEFPMCFDDDFDDSSFEYATPCEGLNTEYCVTDCPRDTLIETIPITKVYDGQGRAIYDCGQNTTGYPVLRVFGKKGDTVRVIFSEELLENNTLCQEHIHNQAFVIKCDGSERIAQPEFTWYGFRCFEVIGDAEPEYVKVVHADVPVSSSFDCDNDTLNWIYKTFMHTMLCNMHTGIPSDCPHIERRGYTGDGQLTCNAALSALDSEKFYRKWLQDIADSQDKISGHIQYTAPYVISGGGPGGWGSAIVEVPYQIYRHTGDSEVLSSYYGNMLRYIDYMEEHSEFGLVTSDKEGDWCLGDWCCPNVLYPELDITLSDQQTIIPAPMVNTYFLVKSLRTMCKIARAIGKHEDVPELERKSDYHARAIQAAYLHTFDGNFVMNIQGANSFAVDIGLGNEQTYPNMVNYYKKLGHLDTGIFATDIVIRTLFENGDAELAVKLLCADGPQGYEHWRLSGATTFHEYWDSSRSRSHNHPMFGASVAYFFEYLLGIKQECGSAGYTSLIIEPSMVSLINRISGSIKTPNGNIAVSYEKNGGKIRFGIEIPEGTVAVLKYSSREIPLQEGKNELCFDIA